MIQQKLPQQISYPTIIPKGFASIYKQWKLDPMTSNKIWANNDIVRFTFMNLGKGVFDPYRSYIQITVTCDSNMDVGVYQVDNSAQSFFDQMVMYSNSVEIQRITNYSVLAAYLSDIGLTEAVSQCRQVQGLGYGSFDTMPFNKAQHSNQISPRYNTNAMTLMTQSSGLIFPTIGSYMPQPSSLVTSSPVFNASKSAKGHITNANPCLVPATQVNGGVYYPSGTTVIDATMQTSGYANNVRAQYNSKLIQNKFPQSTSSYPNYAVYCNYPKQTSITYPFNYQQGAIYSLGIPTTIPNWFYFDNNSASTVQSIPNTTANFGFSSLFCPYYTRGTFQPMISPGVSQIGIYQGMIQNQKTPCIRKKFKIPLISAVMGVLIDPSQFLLIPLKSINQTLIQLTLDPYAMFTSGYKDVCQIDTIGMSVMQGRNYVIQRVRYNLQTYHFVDDQVNRYIQTSLTRQITILTNFWALGNSYQIPGGSGANSSYIVGSNSTHLNQVVALFYSNDYQKYSFCRKHFRLSNCITKYWSKIGIQYWPPQPYKGNAGNVNSNNIDDDNSQFIENIMWLSNYMFSKTALPRMNAYNFAINSRPYDPTNTSTFYDPKMFQSGLTYNFTTSSINSDTAMGMSWIHQNRVVGKAAFVISYTPFSHSDHILQGINVSQLSNFQLVFESNNTQVYPRDQTLYIFYKSSGVVKYTANGIKTLGR